MKSTSESTVEIKKEEIIKWLKIQGHVHSYELVGDNLIIRYSMSQGEPFRFGK